MSTGNSLDDEQSLDFSLVLASSVHDMKNSLTMLLSSLEEVIESTPVQNDVQSAQFATLQYEASRINSELIQLLSIYNMQQQRLSLHIDEVYVIDTLEEQLARNDMLFKTRNIRVEIHCDDDLAWFYDNDLIGNVIHNILINAARYTQEKIRLSASIKDQQLMIDIADDGQGFPDAMLSAASLESVAKNGGDSTQLGLFFAAKVAGLHQQNERSGHIHLTNGPPLGGGVFTIYLP